MGICPQHDLQVALQARDIQAAVISYYMRCRPRALGHETVLRRSTELQLVAWALDLRRDRLLVSSLMLAYKPREYAEEIDMIPAELFVASRPWVSSLLLCHRLSMRARTRQGQHSNGDGVAAVREFRQQVQEGIRAKSIKHVSLFPLLVLCKTCLKRFFFI